ncbi:MAG: ATP-binding protein [Fibrobacter sp.]|nr:ATP-binding protein [Fibrobacter sp.]
MENTISLLDLSSSPWLRVLEYVRSKCNEFGLAFLDAVGFEGIQDGYAQLTVPDTFRATWLESHYGDLFRKAFSAVLGSEFVDYTIRLLAPSAAVPEMKLPAPALTRPVVKPKAKPAVVNDLRLYSRFTFENFVEGNCNSTALRACKTVSENPGDASLNPLFIYGASGLGKTHLLQSIAADLVAKRSEMRVTYCHAADFLRDYTAIYKNHADSRQLQEKFEQRYVRCDCLLIDDIQWIEQGEKTLEKLFSLVAYLRSHGKQVVISCDRHPSSFCAGEASSPNRKSAIPHISRTFLSQLESCVAVGLDEPDMTTRLNLIEKKSVHVPFVDRDREEICRFLSVPPRSNVRDIEGLINWLYAMHTLNGVELDFACVKRLMGGNKNGGAAAALTVRSIADTVAFQFNVDFLALASKRQDAAASVPRKVAMMLCREYTSESLVCIGETFNRDYATVIAALKSLKVQMEKDDSLRRRVEDIRYMLEA